MASVDQAELLAVAAREVQADLEAVERDRLEARRAVAAAKTSKAARTAAKRVLKLAERSRELTAERDLIYSVRPSPAAHVDLLRMAGRMGLDESATAVLVEAGTTDTITEEN